MLHLTEFYVQTAKAGFLICRVAAWIISSYSRDSYTQTQHTRVEFLPILEQAAEGGAPARFMVPKVTKTVSACKPGLFPRPAS